MEWLMEFFIWFDCIYMAKYSARFQFNLYISLFDSNWNSSNQWCIGWNWIFDNNQLDHTALYGITIMNSDFTWHFFRFRQPLSLSLALTHTLFVSFEFQFETYMHTLYICWDGKKKQLSLLLSVGLFQISSVYGLFFITFPLTLTVHSRLFGEWFEQTFRL